LNQRVCPQPNEWSRLWEMLPDKQRKGSGWEPALPLILGAWDDTPAVLKLARFNEHIEWAKSHGVLEEIARYLRSLTEEQWHHIGD
jgi:hypothetical protein